MTAKHFLTLLDLTAAELRGLVARAIELKALNRAGTIHEPFKHKVLAMVFEKSSTRTRMSFEVGMAQLGGTRSSSRRETPSSGAARPSRIPPGCCRGCRTSS